MKKKVRLLFSILLILAAMFIVTTGVSAQEDPAIVFVFDDSEPVTVGTDQPVVLGHGWFATAPGQVNEFLTAHELEVVLKDASGNRVRALSNSELDMYWSEIYSTPLAPFPFINCPMPNLWSADLFYPLGTLPAGQYTLETTETLTHAVNDGLHVCTLLGEPWAPTPSLYEAGTEHHTVTINVVE